MFTLRTEEPEFRDSFGRILQQPLPIRRIHPRARDYLRSIPWPYLVLVSIDESIQRRGIDDHDDGRIGTVTVLEDERFALDLTATDDSGMIGHAYVVLGPGEAGYDPVYQRLRSTRRGFDEVNVAIPLDPF